MKKQRSPYIRPKEAALTEGMSETPEEKAEMRLQIAEARRKFSGEILRLPEQLAPIRREARPRSFEDQGKSGEPMLEEERTALFQPNLIG